MGLSDSPIRIKSFLFACDVVRYCDVLKVNKDFELASQLLRSGTSIGANTREAQRFCRRIRYPGSFWNESERRELCPICGVGKFYKRLPVFGCFLRIF